MKRTLKDIRLVLESFDSAEAHYAYGYLKGYFCIKEEKCRCEK